LIEQTSNETWNDKFKNIECVVSNPVKFSAKLKIDEVSLNSRQENRIMGDVLKAGTAAAAGGIAASSSAVAGTVFGGGWLSALGIGVAVTPVGWILGTAVASGAACYGVLQMLRTNAGDSVQEIPHFIKTHHDALGAALFDLMA